MIFPVKVLAFLLTTRSVLARPPPSVCDPVEINECLNKFEIRLNECEKGDLRCKCDYLLKEGANCYAACPQTAMTTFIQTYDDGICANYDPFVSRKRDTDDLRFNDSQLKGGKDVNISSVPALNGKATAQNRRKRRSSTASSSYSTSSSTTTSSMNTTTSANDEKSSSVSTSITSETSPTSVSTYTSLSPQEYLESLEHSRYKANLRSIRSERERNSLEALRKNEAEPTSQHPRSTATASGTASTKKESTSMSSAITNRAFSIRPEQVLIICLAIGLAFETM